MKWYDIEVKQGLENGTSWGELNSNLGLRAISIDYSYTSNLREAIFMWCFCEILILAYNFFSMFLFSRSSRKSTLSKLGWISIEWKRKRSERLKCKEKTLTKNSLVARNVMSEGPLRFSGSIMRFDSKTALTNTPRTLHSVSWVNRYGSCL